MEPALALDLVVQTLRTASTLLRESRRLFRPHGLSEVQFNVLNVLALQPEGLTQRALSDILVVDRSNVTGLLDRMGAAGWVRREDVPGDRRAYRIRLTPAGRRLRDRVHPAYQRAVLAAVGPLGPARARHALTALRRLETEAATIGRRLADETRHP